MNCPKCNYEIEAKDVPNEPTDEGGAEFICPRCYSVLYLKSPGWPDGELELIHALSDNVQNIKGVEEKGFKSPFSNRKLGRVKSSKEQLDAFMMSEAQKLGLGATGEFPQGKLEKQDEGEIKFGICIYQGKVMLNFGKPCTYVGFDPQLAVQVATIMMKHAQTILAPGGNPSQGNNGKGLTKEPLDSNED